MSDTFIFLTILVSCGVAEHHVIFSQNYSIHERPPTEEGKPVDIEASINLRNILGVAEKEMIISLETTLRLYWKVGILDNLHITTYIIHNHYGGEGLLLL